MAKVIIKDDSGDRDFFTIVPNYILNHSTHTDQALYLQMKRYAGEDGKCFATQETIMNKLGIGRKAYLKSLDYLIKRGWVEFVGMTGSKTRPIKTYKINNIWQQNSEHYKKIPSESNISFEPEIPSERIGDTVQKKDKIPSESASIRRTILNKNQEEEPYSKAIALPFAKDIPLVIEAFTKVNKACGDFYGNTTQRKYTDKLIATYGLEKVIQVVSFLPVANRKLYNKATTPKELWDKWSKIEAEAQMLKSGNKYQGTKIF